MTSELEDLKTCPKCQMPLEKAGSGSLTQWIKVCNCGRPGPDKSLDVPVNICATCGKRIEAGRTGTLTQWIFRADLCRCEAPAWIGNPDEAAVESSDTVEQLQMSEVEELPMEAGTFPVERYKPIRRIGMGASGTIYLCQDRLLKKKVAVKVLNSLSSEQLVSFQREAKATSQIEHPNIVKVFDFGVSDGKAPYMVLEYIDGLSLDQILKNEGALDLDDALPIFSQICDALSFSHNRNLFHRDLKPENIIVAGWKTPDVSIRVIDFGVGVIRQERTDQGKSVAGSPPYMSPDQAHGLTFDERSEIYSMGCVMFEVLTGRPPFQGSTALETISLHAHAEPPTLADGHGSAFFPEALEDLVANCLRKTPAERYQSMEELKNALLDLESEQHPRAATNESKLEQDRLTHQGLTRWIVVSLLAIGTIGSIIVFQSGRQPVKTIEVSPSPKTPKYKEPMLSDALDTLESDTWYKGKNGFGRVIWNSAPNINDNDFEQLTKESDVRCINVGITDNVTGTGFKYLKNAQLEDVFVQSTGLTDDGLREICEFKTLTSIRLAMASRLTLKGLGYLKTLPALESLNLTVMEIPDHALELISTMPKLTAVVFYNSHKIKASDLRYLSALRTMHYLDLSGTSLTNEIFPYIAKIKSLTNIRICNLDLTDENLELLAELPNLTDVGLADNPRLTDNALIKLGACKHLETVVLDRCSGITAAGKSRFKKEHPQVMIRSIVDSGVRIRESIEVLDDTEFLK